MEEKDQNVVDELDNELDFDDFDDFDEETETSENASKEEPKKQSREENREQAKARREREQKQREEELKLAVEKARKEGYEEGKRVSNLDNNKVNSFTGKPIEDEYDLKIYDIQKKIKEDGGDPINDLPSKLAEIRRNETKTQQEEAEKKAKSQENVRTQLAEFKAAYPDLDHKAVLTEGSSFRNYAMGKMGGSKTLKQIYDDYSEFVSQIVGNKGSQNELEQGIEKGQVPSAGKVTKPVKKSVLEMSDEEFMKKWVDTHGSF